MMEIGVRQFGDPVLREKAKHVDLQSTDLKGLTETLISTMQTAQGVGIAAPQIGVLKRLIVYMFDEAYHVCINPQIIEEHGEIIAEEGCLSLAGIQIPVMRAETVTFEALDSDGNSVRREVSGLEARIVQHEVDHLDGILIIDRVSPDIRKQAIDLYEDLKKREY